MTPPHPPTPSGSNFLRSLRFRKDPFALLSEYRSEYGDVFSFTLPGLGRWVFICSHEVAAEFYKAPDDKLSAPDFNYAFLARMLGRNSFVVEEAAEHRHRRRPLTPHFNGRGANEETDTVRQVAEYHIDRWPDDQVIPLYFNAMKISLESLFRIMTRITDQEKLDRLVHVTQEFFDKGMKSPLVTMPLLQWNLGRFSPWGRVVWLRERLRSMLREEFRSLRSSPCPAHRSALNSLFDYETEDGESLDIEAIIDDFIVIINAGQETSSRITGWTIAGVLSRPEVHKRLMEELHRVLGDGPIEMDHLFELEYLDAVIQEGIRYRPFSPFISGRIVREPVPLGGYTMPKGSVVVHAHAEVCKREDLFPAPDGFNPEENFLGRKFSRNDWVPFGAGPRLCLGRGVALVQLKVLLATIFRRLELESVLDVVKPVPAGFLMAPEQGLPIRIKKRR